MIPLTSFVILATVALLCQASHRENNDQNYRVVCVHESQSFYRLGHGKFTVEDIDPKLCTHLVYGYAGIHNNKVRALDGYLDLESNFGKGNFKKFTELRNANPHLTTLLTVGGRDEGAIKFSDLAGDPVKRKYFVDSCLETVVQYGFDGINLDWQYPAHKGGVPLDKAYFTTLLQDLRSAFDNEGYVLTATLGAKKDVIDQAYEVDKISSIVDFLLVLTYDYKQSNERTTGLSSPLYAGPNDNNPQDNVDFTIQYLIKKGAPPNKLVLSASCYGQTWTLDSETVKLPGSKSIGPGESWPYTKEAGTIGYNEFCESQKDISWTLNWQDYEKSAYATHGNQWISYESAESITEKCDYVVQHGLGGLLLHGIESDDGKGRCSGIKFPLLHAANVALRDTHPPTPPVFTSTPQTTTKATPDEFVCPHTGFFRHPKDCSKYYQCVNSGRLSKHLFDCPPGTLFHQNKGLCDWQQNVKDCP